jgi:hypothetical protein
VIIAGASVMHAEIKGRCGDAVVLSGAWHLGSFAAGFVIPMLAAAGWMGVAKAPVETIACPSGTPAEV